VHKMFDKGYLTIFNSGGYRVWSDGA
jgi:hypothetical protein